MTNFKLKKSHIFLIYFAACVIKLILASLQYPLIYPGYAPIDDDLMFDAAVSISSGNWLGEYSYITISKHMFFSIWLSFVNFIQIPYLVANCILWIGASFYAVYAFKPILKSNLSKCLLFCGILYNPSISAEFSLRVYRDSIFPIICMFFFFSIIAIGLRHKEDFKKLISSFIVLGVSFGSSYLTREDGYWTLPFLIVAFTFLIFKWFKNKDKQKTQKSFGILISVALSISMIFSYSYMNYLHYDRFIVSDFSSNDFSVAYGAITSIKSDTFHPMVSVSSDMRESLTNEVPSFALISDYFDNAPVKTAYYHNETEDYKAGAFYWALRLSLELEGIYETPKSAQNYYETLTNEIQSAVNENRLETYNGSTKLRTSITPIITKNHVIPTLEETANSFFTVLFFKQCNPIANAAIGDLEEINAMNEYIHQSATTVAQEGSSQSHLDLKRIPAHEFLKAVNSLYSFIVPIMFIISIVWQIKQFIALLQDKKEHSDNLLNLILLGILGMAILRCAMIAFMEVAAFGIGTYGMYLSTVYPLIVVYSFIGFIKTFEN